MKVMILAAGEGKRMGDLTVHTPKPLLTIDGQPMIVRIIKQLKQAGFNEIVINAFHLADDLFAALGSGEQLGVQIQFSDERPYGHRLETGGGIRLALPLLGDQPFLVVSSDIVTDFPFASLRHLSPSHAHLILVNNPPFHPEGDFSLDKQGEQDLITLTETNRYTYGNIGVFSPSMFEPLPIQHLPLSKLLLPYITSGLITGELYQGQWDNIGTPQQLASSQHNAVQ